MFALPSDYVTAQDAGKAFAAEYYGRLNESAESVVDMFAEQSRYYSMDSLNGRPAVGRPDVAREVRRFLGTYSGGRRFVRIVSVDAQIDDGEPPRDDDYHGQLMYSDDSCSDRVDTDDTDDFDDGGGQYLAVFVRAEWTDSERRTLAPLPFVQTFRVRCLGDADFGYGFEIVITIVKTMGATVQPPRPQRHLLPRRSRLLDANHRGFSYSGRGENNYKTPIIGKFKQETYAGHTKRLNAEAREFELWSNTTLPPFPAVQSTDDELEMSDDDEDPLSTTEQYLAYRDHVKAFLEEPFADHRRRPATTTTDARPIDLLHDDRDAVDRPTDLLHVDRLDKSITADQLYAAFGRYGKVLWVRVLPGGHSSSLATSGSCYPYHSARVRFHHAESVDKALADHQGPGCTIGGVRVSFSRSKPGQ